MVLQSFGMTRDGCTGKNQQYKFGCGAAEVGSSTTKHSGCALIDDKKVQYLDRQNVQCDDGAALLGFTTVDTGCTGNNMRYKYKCGTKAEGAGSGGDAAPAFV